MNLQLLLRSVLVLLLGLPSMAQESLAGTWRDSNGDTHTMTHEGSQLRVVPDSAAVRKWWDEGTGVLQGSTVRMDHKKGGVLKDRQTGSLSAGPRIRWGNGSEWVRIQSPTETAPSTAQLAGVWRDSNGDSHDISQQGADIQVVPQSTAVRKWWDRAAGTIEGNVIKMEHLKGERVTDRQQGQLVAGPRINWSNGSHWVRVSVETDSDTGGYRPPPPPEPPTQVSPLASFRSVGPIVEAAVSWGANWLTLPASDSYLFRGPQYLRFDRSAGRASGSPALIRDGWRMYDSFGDGIDAAVNWRNGKVYLFRGDKYLRYTVGANQPDAGYPQLIAGAWGMPVSFASNLDAAVNWGNGKVYFFKGDQYLRYDVKKDAVDAGYPAPIAGNWGFPTSFRDNLDAVVNWGNGTAYFFKGDEYLAYSIAEDRVKPGYPAKIEGNWKGLTQTMGSPNGSLNVAVGATYRFELHTQPDRFLAVGGSSPGVGSNIVLAPRTEGDEQRFRALQSAPGVFQLQTSLGNDLVVDSGTDGRLRLQARNSSTSQQFRPIESGGVLLWESLASPGHFIGLRDGSLQPEVLKPGPGHSVRMHLRGGDHVVSLFPETYTVPVTRQPLNGEVGFFNEGGYVAKFTILYDHDHAKKNAFGNRTVHLTTGRMAVKEPRKTFTIPDGARNIHIWGEAHNGNLLADDPWITIFHETFDAPPSVCFKTYDTVFSPSYNYDCEPWVPKFEGTVHVSNATGERLYVSYCKDLEWSLANMGTGMLTGLLLDSTQKTDPSAIRWMVAALMYDLPLPDEMYDLFREAAFTIEPEGYKVVVHSSVWDTLSSLWDLVTDSEKTAALVGLNNITRTDEWQAQNLEFNPIIAGASIFGAETLNIVIFNHSMTRYWIIPTGWDDSWIVQGDGVVKAKSGHLWDPAGLGQTFPSLPVPR